MTLTKLCLAYISDEEQEIKKNYVWLTVFYLYSAAPYFMEYTIP